MSLSTWIMKLATRRPPEGREDWVQAMQAEFETLNHGKIGWALGCLATTAGWRLRADAVYLLTIVAGIILFKDIVIQTMTWAPENYARPVYDIVYIFPYSYFVWTNLPFAALCVGIGAWRPERVIMTAIVATLTAITHSNLIYTFFSQTLPISLLPFYSPLPFVAETALLLIALISAGSGAWLRTRLMRTV